MAFSAAVSSGNVSPKYLIGDHSTSYRATPLNTSSVTKLVTQLPTGQSVKAWSPDESLPVQEEPEEDGEQNDT